MHESADDLTQELVKRVSGATGIRVVTASASAAVAADSVEIRLLAVLPRSEPRARDRADMLSLDYLVAVRVTDALVEHRAVADILFALTDDAELTVMHQSAAEACGTLGLPIAPGCVVRGTVARVRPAEPVPLVRFPLDARIGDLAMVRGTVLGPAETPVMGALVSVIGIDRFVLETGPRQPESLALYSRAGYAECEPWGQFVGKDFSVCMSKSAADAPKHG
jgi:hypothetical protein